MPDCRDPTTALWLAIAIRDAKIESDAKVIAALREKQWPDEATEEMKRAVYALNLGDNRLSEDDVIDIYDTFRKVALGVDEQAER
jgi:hypothetical protein